MEDIELNTFWITLIIIAAVVVAVLVVLYFVGKKMKKKQEEQQVQMDAIAQTMSILVIDKKKLRLKNAGLPAIVMEQAPRFARLSKMPIVKAKVGPRIVTFICDDKVYNVIPLKRECKVVVSGLYITDIKGAHGGLDYSTRKKKSKFWGRLTGMQ